jgi:hypothetical protein
MPADSLSPEDLLALATKARGDIFPEWKPLAHAAPETYRLITGQIGLRAMQLADGA